ncbi:hypothetical protein SDC9_127754 [bioreactor metagenome]|uniref:NAD-specific glutamate dehydrogenase n=1 Tax=bioreactor metagenome TaxID=1076179 RepID=A0A645CUY1_9ZZZZ
MGFAEATAHQVVQLLFGDFGNFRFVLQGDSAVVDFVERDCVGSGDVIHDDRVAFDMRNRSFRFLAELPLSAVFHCPAVFGDRLGNDRTGRVRRVVDHFRAGILQLAFAGECYGKHRSFGATAVQEDTWVFHGHFGTQVAVDPFHGRIFQGYRTFRHQVVDVSGPVLDGRVAAVSILLHNDLNNCGMQAVGRISRSGTTFNIVDAGAFVDDDQRAFELAGAFVVDAEVSLQRHIANDAFRHIDERSSGPDGRIQGRFEVVGRRYDAGEVFLEDFRIFLQGRVRIGEDDAQFLELILHVVVDGFRLILDRYAGQIRALGFRDPDFFEGFLYFVRHIFPGSGYFIGCLLEIGDFVELQMG